MCFCGSALNGMCLGKTQTEADWLRESSGKQLFVSTFCGAQVLISPLCLNGLNYIRGNKYLWDQIFRQSRVLPFKAAGSLTPCQSLILICKISSFLNF